MEEKNKVKFSVCGYEFVIRSEDSEEYMRKVGEQVENRVQRLLDQSGSMSTTMAALFAALEYCDEAAKAREAADNLRAQIREYLDEAAAAKSEAGELRRKLAGLSRELGARRPAGKEPSGGAAV